MSQVELKDCRPIINTAEPFRGFIVSVMEPCGRIAYTEHTSLESYKAERGAHFEAVTWEEVDRLTEQFEQSLREGVEPESLDDYFYALECLPPGGFGNTAGVEHFYITERITGDLVRWHLRRGDDCFVLVDYASANPADIVARLGEL